MMQAKARALLLSTVMCAGCNADDSDDGTDPTVVNLGETTFVVILNPAVDDLNDRSVPSPGPVREGVAATARPASATTGPLGIAVLRDVDAGDVDLGLAGHGLDASVSTNIRDRDLVELAIAADEDGAAQMARVVYRFGDEVVELHPDDSIDAVNDAISASNRIVFLAGGVYHGDLEFSGSDVTLFGAGATGGEVTIVGNVTVSGSGNRIRGAHIQGDLDLSGSDAGMSFSMVDGHVEVSGSDGVFLESTFCGPVDVSGGGSTFLGNRGLEGGPPPECP
jgi:hypothetical protein